MAQAAQQLPVTKGLLSTLAAPGFGVVSTVVPAPAVGPVTRTAAAADETEEDMYGAMQELRVATVARNVEVQEEVDEVRARRAAASAFLEAEVQEREAQFEAMKRHVEQACLEAEAEMSSALGAAFQRNEDAMPTLHGRLDVAEARAHKFYYRDIPTVNERMCGESIRTMDSHREALQLDAATSQGRENRIWERIGAHLRRFRLRADAETEDRLRQYKAYDAQFYASMAREDELAGLSSRRISGAITAAKTALEDEAKARSLVDAELLTQMHAALERIQAQALQSFGAHVEDEEEKNEEESGGGRASGKEEGASSGGVAAPPSAGSGAGGAAAVLARQPSSGAVVPQTAAAAQQATIRAAAGK